MVSVKTKGGIPEYWLYWTFQDFRLLKWPLKTTANLPVTVIQPGRQNRSDGPDFLKAILDIGGIRYCGDLEFHISAEDWFRHGHHEDERYRGIILHILWNNRGSIPKALLQRFPHVILKSQLAHPEEQWFQKMAALEDNFLNTDFSKNPKFPISEVLIAEFAEKRFQRKIDRVEKWRRYFSFEDACYLVLSEALGYSQNKFPFLQLMWQCPPSQLYQFITPMQRSSTTIWVYLMLRANLFGLQDNCPLPNSSTLTSFDRQIYCQFHDRGVYPLLKLHDWHFSRVRPTNSPYLRLGALAQLLNHYQSPSLFQKLLNIAKQRSSIDKTLTQWVACLRLPWERKLLSRLKYSFRIEGNIQYLMGTTRCRQFIINGLLPLLHVWGEQTGNNGFQTFIEGCYESFPSTEHLGIIKNQTRLVTGGSLLKKVKNFGFYQQGLLELMTQPLKTPRP